MGDPRAPSGSWLRGPAERAAGRLAFSCLAEARRAARRLGRVEDREALHDLRIALRKSRTWLRAFRDVLKSPRALEARLKRLAAGTNAARDAEVYLACLEEDGLRPSGPRSAALSALASRLRLRAARGRRAALARVVPALAALPAAPAGSRGRMAPMYADCLSKGLRRLAEHLARLRPANIAREGHKCRIWAKRLRYLIEPFGKAVRKGRKTAKNLKRLQDSLGRLHDWRGLRGFITRHCREADDPQVLWVLGKLEKREARLFKRFKSDWLGKRPRRHLRAELELKS